MVLPDSPFKVDYKDASIHTRVSVCVCVYIYTHTHRNRADTYASFVVYAYVHTQ